MAFANSTISDIVATTIQSRSGVLADSVKNNIPTLNYLNKRGNVKPFSGGNVILQEVMYDDASSRTAQYYNGYEVINVQQNSPISAAQFDIKQAAASVVISGLEELQNAGEEAFINLLDGRLQVAEAQLMNLIDSGINSDGTGTNGKQITGLQAAVPDNPTTGVYGGIDRSVWNFWRSQKYSGVTDGGAAVTSANIQTYMNALAVKLVRGSDKPSLILADNNYYQMYLNSLQAIQRVTSTESAGAGFAALKYFGAGFNCDVVLGGGIAGSVPSNHMYFLNLDYLFFRPHRERNFVPIGGERQSVNQDAVVKLIGWAGNLTASAPRYSGVLIA